MSPFILIPKRDRISLKEILSSSWFSWLIPLTWGVHDSPLLLFQTICETQLMKFFVGDRRSSLITILLKSKCCSCLENQYDQQAFHLQWRPPTKTVYSFSLCSHLIRIVNVLPQVCGVPLRNRQLEKRNRNFSVSGTGWIISERCPGHLCLDAILPKNDWKPQIYCI